VKFKLNTYGVWLDNGSQVDFDEPSLELVEVEVAEPKRSTWGPEKKVPQTNR